MAKKMKWNEISSEWEREREGLGEWDRYANIRKSIEKETRSEKSFEWAAYIGLVEIRKWLSKKMKTRMNDKRTWKVNADKKALKC